MLVLNDRYRDPRPPIRYSINFFHYWFINIGQMSSYGFGFYNKLRCREIVLLQGLQLIMKIHNFGLNICRERFFQGSLLLSCIHATTKIPEHTTWNWTINPTFNYWIQSIPVGESWDWLKHQETWEEHQEFHLLFLLNHRL